MDLRGLERIDRKQIVAVGLTLVALVGAFRVSRFIGELNRAAASLTLDSGPQASLLYDRNGSLIYSLFAEERVDRRLDQLSPTVIPAVLAAEDKGFMRHAGVDVVRIGAAAWKNVRSGRVRQGASTITQQLVRAQALGRERTWSRKMREVLLALRAERRFTKGQILETYLNRIYLGDGYFGLQAAAMGYFGKDVSELDLVEAATLAGIIRCPSTCSPRKYPERAKARRDTVLRAMERSGGIDETALQSSVAADVSVVEQSPDGSLFAGGLNVGDVDGGYFVQAVRRSLVARFGEDAVLRGGLRVYTTLDVQMQREAERAVSVRLDALNARETKARRGQPNPNRIEGSLVAIDPKSGEVRALVGGRSFAESPFNRAIQARRQPGSAFKPLFFAAALEQGYSPSSVVADLDAPIAAAEGAWLPGDGEHEAGSYTLRRALTVSSNRAAARLMQLVGVRNAMRYAQQMGISSPMPAVPSLALGTAEVSLLDLTAAYGVFANGGIRVAPTLITRVETASGETLWRSQQNATRAIREETAFIMSTMLADVINRGTGTGVRAAGFRLPAAGKTGTTDSYADAWFVGYTPKLVAGVWFGRDAPAAIMRGGYAATVAVPAWADFMKGATRGEKAAWYTAPATLERAAVCQVTGLRATENCRLAAEYGEGGVYDDYFLRGRAPVDECAFHAEEFWSVPMEGDAALPISATTGLGAIGSPRNGQANHH